MKPADTITPPLLEVQNLRIQLRTPRGLVDAVRDVSFVLQQGDTLGLVGESGCGKSLTALALMGLLPESAQVNGSIRLQGQELVGLDDPALCRIRGNRIAMVFQEPMTALNPVHRIGHQVAEPLRRHQGLGAAAARAEALALLERVGIPQAAQRLDQYPHQFSGGQRQRITIAMALACKPALLLADEPTTALDVTVQRQILELIQGLVEEHHMGLLLISHDLGLIARNTARLLVMYGGSVVERGPTAAVLQAATHPYTRGLLASRPRLGVTQERLEIIPGSPPDPRDIGDGCVFYDRCTVRADPRCATERPDLRDIGGGHRIRTFCEPEEVGA